MLLAKRQGTGAVQDALRISGIIVPRAASWSVHPPQYCYGGRAAALRRFSQRHIKLCLERFHLSCSADILVCGFAGHSCPVFHPYESGDWKVARTRRLESLRYIITVNFLG